jgi:hypothetical protein
MDLSKLLPIIDKIVKESLNDRVYIYGRTGRSLTKRVATGNLKNSIKSVIEKDNDGLQIIKLEAFGKPLENTYAYWLINDRKPGGRPPVKDIEQWIRNKKDFKIRDMKTGRFLPKNEKNIKSVAYVISRSIGKFGFKNKPENFIEISSKKIFENKEILQLLEGAAYDEILKALE